MMTRFVLTLLVGLVVSLGGCQEPLKRLNKSAGSLGSTLASDRIVCNAATSGGKWLSARNNYVIEAKSRGLSCGVYEAYPIPKKEQKFIAALTDEVICRAATFRKGKVQWKKSMNGLFPARPYVFEAKRRGLSCGVGKTVSSIQTASAPVTKAKPKVTSAALTAAEKEAERLRQELAALRAEKAEQQQTISGDTKLPTITIASASSKGKQGIIRGRVNDNTGIAEVTVGGKSVPFDVSGNFRFETFVPAGGKEVTIQVTDLNGLSNSKTVKLDRTASNTTTAITFDSLNPLGRNVAKNKDALALIIGVDGYENTPARAIYADSDAKVFADYANEKLGIPIK